FKGLPEREGLFAMGGFCPVTRCLHTSANSKARSRDRALLFLAAGMVDCCTINLAILIVTFAGGSFLSLYQRIVGCLVINFGGVLLAKRRGGCVIRVVSRL
ncbi:hypothetical protein, partial [Aeromonas sobria]|uniref:hypothetical protein n=1 Tax=Aeromonas sobria TaxID=646 RepID=UPI0019D554BA